MKMTTLLAVGTKLMGRIFSQARSSSSTIAATPVVSHAKNYDHRNYSSVLVPIVMEAEAAPFVEHLKLKLVDGFFPSQTPFLAYSGSQSDTKITVVTVGKDNVYGTGVDNVSFRKNELL